MLIGNIMTHIVNKAINNDGYKTLAIIRLGCLAIIICKSIPEYIPNS